MVVEEELVRAPRSKKFDKFLVDRYLSIPGQSNPSAKGKEGRRYFIGCFSVLIELKRLILLRKTIRVRD